MNTHLRYFFFGDLASFRAFVWENRLLLCPVNDITFTPFITSRTCSNPVTRAYLSWLCILESLFFKWKQKLNFAWELYVEKKSVPPFFSRHSRWNCCWVHFGMFRMGYVFTQPARSTGCVFTHAMFSVGVSSFRISKSCEWNTCCIKRNYIVMH